jgi:hypothetical protein
MRVFFEMPARSYLRMYGSTLRELAGRGHHVLLCYDRPDKSDDEAAAEIEAHPAIEIVSPLPRAKRPGEERIARRRAGIDYLRYLDHRFAGAPYLRRRLEPDLGGPYRWLTHAPGGLPFVPWWTRRLLAREHRVPSDPGVEQALAAHAPDVVFVTPLIGRSNRNRRQTDTVKAARALGVPVAFGVATWDHLTTKGLVKETPDRGFVWNEIHRGEAVDLHGVPAGRVAVTGAQLFDDWFDRQPTTTREELLVSAGLPGAGGYVLYVGSSPNIAPPSEEIAFVRRWLAALRESGDGRLGEVAVLVRPHPYSVEAWAAVDLAGLGAAVVPRTAPATPMTEADLALYFDSIHHSSAVVGINTTAMVEAFIQRRPVLTIRAPEFRETQAGTLHFRDLSFASGDALQAAETIEEHISQLGATLADPERHREGIEEFLRRFVRPLGLERPATPVLVDGIEELARSGDLGGGRSLAQPPGDAADDADGRSGRGEEDAESTVAH